MIYSETMQNSQAIINNDMSTVSSRSESFQICISFFTFPTWCPSPQPTQAEPERWSRKWPWKRKPWRFGGVKNLEAFEKKKVAANPPMIIEKNPGPPCQI